VLSVFGVLHNSNCIHPSTIRETGECAVLARCHTEFTSLRIFCTVHDGKVSSLLGRKAVTTPSLTQQRNGDFDVSLTVHLSIILDNDQLDAQIFKTFITILYMHMFRAISCSTSRGQTVYQSTEAHFRRSEHLSTSM
jgi:hypothetical protein